MKPAPATDTERRTRLAAVQTSLQALWTRIEWLEYFEESTPANKRSAERLWERFRKLEAEER